MVWLSSACLLRLCSIGILVTVVVNLGLPYWHAPHHAEDQQKGMKTLPWTQTLASLNKGSRNHTARRDDQAAILENMINRDVSNPQKHFSACLLIRDDNQLLNEWIAYHYHTLKLRYLVVAVDPDSQASPRTILQRWQNLTDLRFLEWSDVDYMPDRFLRNGYVIPLQRINGNASASKYHAGHEDETAVRHDLQRIHNHRFRQLTFLSACYRHLRHDHKTWVLHIDTDEYLTVNPVLRRKGKLGQLAVPTDLRPSHVLFRFLSAIRYRPRLNKQSNFPCISLPRLLFGSLATTTTKEHIEVQSIPFRLDKFETLQWKHHTSYVDRERNALPKVIVDVSVVNETDEMFQRKAFSIHRPSKKLCRFVDQIDFNKTDSFPLVVNHYLGSWERYTSRQNDTRRSRSAYDAKAFVNEGSDDWIISWIDGFLDYMDPKIAKELLQDYH